MDLVQLKAVDIPQVRDTILQAQDYMCPVCKKKVDKPVLDHSHTKRNHGTGLVRGVLCSACNIFIAKSENNCSRYGINNTELPKVLRNTADYLEAPHTNFIHPSESPKIPRLKKSCYNKVLRHYKKYPLLWGKAGKKVPPYPTSGKLNAPLTKLFKCYHITPEFY